MEDALPALVPAPMPAKSAASRRARRIVYATLAIWLVFSCMIVFMSSSDEEGTSPLATFGFVVGLPGLGAGCLGSLLSNTMAWVGVVVFSIALAGLEIFAWRRRITWLAVVLMAWIVVHAGIGFVIYYMAQSDSC